MSFCYGPIAVWHLSENQSIPILANHLCSFSSDKPFDQAKLSADNNLQLAAMLLRQPLENGTPFEPMQANNPAIPSKKPTAKNDDGLCLKESRDDCPSFEPLITAIVDATLRRSAEGVTVLRLLRLSA